MVRAILLGWSGLMGKCRSINFLQVTEPNLWPGGPRYQVLTQVLTSFIKF